MTGLRIAYDRTLMRPGCAVVQAGLGGTPGIANAFDSHLWLVAPTDDMRVYPLRDEEQLARLIQITEAHHKEKAPA